jgi:hypothetical protein
MGGERGGSEIGSGGDSQLADSKPKILLDLENRVLTRKRGKTPIPV